MPHGRTSAIRRFDAAGQTRQPTATTCGRRRRAVRARRCELYRAHPDRVLPFPYRTASHRTRSAQRPPSQPMSDPMREPCPPALPSPLIALPSKPFRTPTSPRTSRPRSYDLHQTCAKGGGLDGCNWPRGRAFRGAGREVQTSLAASRRRRTRTSPDRGPSSFDAADRPTCARSWATAATPSGSFSTAPLGNVAMTGAASGKDPTRRVPAIVL